MEKILKNIDDHPGYLEAHNINRYIHDILDTFGDDMVEHVSQSYKQLYSHGDSKAEEKTATIHELKNRFSVENTLFKKMAKSFDRHNLDMEHRRSNLGGKIKTLTEDIKNQVVDGLSNHMNASPLIKEIISKQRDRYDEELAKTSDKSLREEIKKKIRELYTKQKYKVERAVRTEAMNATSRAQLLRYKEMDVKEVGLETSHDLRVCAKCRMYEYTKKTWDIQTLLLLGAYPLTTLTHPQCRCTFVPVINDVEYDNNIGEIKNIPRNETSNIERLVKEIEFTTPIEFVDDITGTQDFLDSRTQYYVNKGENLARAKIQAENDVHKFKDKVSTLTVGTGKNMKVLLDSKANKSNRFTYLVSRIQAQRIWDRVDSKKTIQPKIRDLFKEKRFERMKSKTHKQLLFSRQARGSAKEYFSEGYAHFIVHPQVLKEIDPELFNYMKYNIFKGRDFLKYNF